MARLPLAIAMGRIPQLRHRIRFAAGCRRGPEPPGDAGRGLHLEYKEKLPETREAKRKVLKTAVAFANGAGGTLMFGVQDEREGVTGIDGNEAVERRRLNDLVRDLVSPSPRVQIESARLDGHLVLVMHVQPGGGTIHALFLDANKPEFMCVATGPRSTHGPMNWKRSLCVSATPQRQRFPGRRRPNVPARRPSRPRSGHARGQPTPREGRAVRTGPQEEPWSDACDVAEPLARSQAVRR